MAKPTCVVVGVGPGNGASFARKFAREGYRVALLARNLDYLTSLAATIPESQAYAYDVTDPARAAQVFEQMRADLGPVDVLVYNAGAGKFAPIDNATPQDFESAWRVNALGCAIACQQVIPDMRARRRGHIVIIGATASIKSGAHSAPFASAKAAQRGLAQSMARHLGPDGIHVAYVILDGVVNLERTRKAMPDRPDEFFMRSDDIAQAVYFLTQQPPSAWSFEIDLRPFGEKW
jgi:NADP-dependent 3-hydroxy acid dehydrogenase YdfG